LDLENVLNRKYFEEENYETIKAAFEFLGLDFSKKSYIFLDEIQYIRNLPSIVKYLKDHYDIKFFLTGSASFYLKNLFSESLAGRKYIFNIYPLTFREFIVFKGHNVNGLETPPENINKILESLFLEYINFGGFPAVALKEAQEEKKRKLRDIFSSYFEMEVERLKDFAKLQKVRDVLLLLFSRSASLLDVSKLASEIGISWITLKEYLDFFEKTFFFDFVKPYSSNKDVEIRKRTKCYPVDVGLAKEIGIQDTGRLFEIAIYQNIKTKAGVNYYRKKNGQEIDFVLDKKYAIEIKSASNEKEIEALKRRIANLQEIKDFKIITYNRQPQKIEGIEWGPHFCLRFCA